MHSARPAHRSFWASTNKWNLRFGPLGPEKRPNRPDSGHLQEKPTWRLRSHQNFGRSPPWNCPDWWTSCWMGTAGERMIMLMLSKVVWETKSWRCCRQLCLDSDKCNFWVIFDFRFSLRPSSWSWRPTKLIRCWIGVYRNAPSCLLSTEPLQWPKKMAISLLGQRYVEYIGYLQCHCSMGEAMEIGSSKFFKSKDLEFWSFLIKIWKFQFWLIKNCSNIEGKIFPCNRVYTNKQNVS